MKRIISAILLCVVLAGCMFTMASCSNATEAYAKKINKAADAKEYYTYDEVVEDLGDEAIEIALLKTGVIIAVKGCTSLDEVEDKVDDGKTLKGIVVTVVAGKATGAEYREITKDDLK
jgi:flagellar basal body-associated protein FliL